MTWLDQADVVRVTLQETGAVARVPKVQERQQVPTGALALGPQVHLKILDGARPDFPHAHGGRVSR